MVYVQDGGGHDPRALPWTGRRQPCILPGSSAGTRIAFTGGGAERHPIGGSAFCAASSQTRKIPWVVDSSDNGSLPFLIVDKKDAKVFVFDVQGHLLGAAPALVGLAHGDHTVPGIGTRPLSKILPEERTTPAGRFVAFLGRDLGKLDILWVDYDAGISLHRVIKGTAKEQRARRLATETPLDNRISFGCINVPVEFFDRIVETAFTGTKGVVYILPEIQSMREVFPAYYDVPA
jgi:hypothetical protein